ncbi:MAG: hypothetical protein L3J11_00460 [Draconibacterium sp.]|nr:hypothetical protein [Draconibacterium sp.]
MAKKSTSKPISTQKIKDNSRIKKAEQSKGLAKESAFDKNPDVFIS